MPESCKCHGHMNTSNPGTLRYRNNFRLQIDLNQEYYRPVAEAILSHVMLAGSTTLDRQGGQRDRVAISRHQQYMC
jgi:hypothetical protein